MNEILKIQDKGRSQIDNQLQNKNDNLDSENLKFYSRSALLEKDTKFQKKTILLNKADYVEKVNYMVKKENTNIKMILGVYILQK